MIDQQQAKFAAVESPDDDMDTTPEGLASARPLGDLDLSTRPYCALLDANIQTIGQLAQMSEGQVWSMKNIGRISLGEIKEALGKLGLSLGMKLDAQGRLIRRPMAIDEDKAAAIDPDEVPYRK